MAEETATALKHGGSNNEIAFWLQPLDGIHVQGNPVNWIDPWGLHSWPADPTHQHSSIDLDAYAVFKDGVITFYKKFDELNPLEQKSIEFHELQHKEYPKKTEDEVWKEQLEFIKKQLEALSPGDPCRKILENWEEKIKNMNDEREFRNSLPEDIPVDIPS